MTTISAVIPLYNKFPHVERALRSILAQTRLPEEIIVVDDGSTDGGAEVVKSLQDPRIVLIQQPNQGTSVARNRGAEEARGELLAFLDADDAWEPGFLETILHLWQKYPHAGILATAYKIINEDGSEEFRNFQSLLPNKEDGIIENYFKVGLSFPVWTSAVAIPKKIFQEVGGFKVGERPGQDVDLWLRLALRYPIAWSRACLAIYYRNVVNRSSGVKLWQAEPAISISAREAIAAGLVPPEQVKDLKEYVAFFQTWAANDLLIQGKKDEALKVLDYCRGTRRFARQWWKWRLAAAIPGDSAVLWKIKRSVKRWLRVPEKG